MDAERDALDFQGRVALVTGAARGIGFGVAAAFAARGASLALVDRDAAGLDAAARRLTAWSAGDASGSGTGRVVTVAGDVSDPTVTARAVEAAVAGFGRVDVTVPCAGVYPRHAALELGPAAWDEVLGTNAKGTFFTCQAAARQMVRQGDGGSIITIASGAYRSAQPGWAHYCASKAAVVMLTRVLALELAGHGIRCNCVAPGLVDVGAPEAVLPRAHVEAVARLTPLGRAGTPADVAGAVLFLASPLAEYVTGAVLAVDGGLSAGRSGPPGTTAGAEAGEMGEGRRE